MKNYLSEIFNTRLISLVGSISAALIIFASNTQAVQSISSSEVIDSKGPVIEYLMLSVPTQEKEAWLNAERQTWEPWLNRQKGFVGRQLLWDPNNEEAILLITWSTRSLWKDIPQIEIDRVQELFEQIAMDLTGDHSSNPFPIKSQGELFPQ